MDMPPIRQNWRVDCRGVPALDHIFFYYYLIIVGACGTHVQQYLTLRLLGWRVWRLLVVTIVHLTSLWMRRRVIFLMVWRVSHKIAKEELDGGWTFPSLFSLLYPKLHSSPQFYYFFILVPSLWIVLYGPYSCYVNFDLFQLCPLIEIDYILHFHFNLYSFNFHFAFKSLNIFGTKDFNFSIFSFN